jgi:hypothetical protein
VGTDHIVVDYLIGMTVPDLARKLHRTNRTISHLLREAGVLGTLQRRRDQARRGRPSPAHLRAPGLGGHPTDQQWAYISGLLDGEGSIVARGAPTVPGGHVRYVLSIVQKDPTPLAWIRDTVGAGAIHFAGGTHRYQVPSQRAVFEFLLGVEHHLVLKRQKAEAALEARVARVGSQALAEADGRCGRPMVPRSWTGGGTMMQAQPQEQSGHAAVATDTTGTPFFGSVLVVRSEGAHDRHGRPYLRLALRTEDGRLVEARWWRYPYPLGRRPQVGQVCRVWGVQDQFAGRFQLRVHTMRPAPEVPVTTFVGVAATPMGALRA